MPVESDLYIEEKEKFQPDGLWIFPGQGSLEVGVGGQEYDESGRAREVFSKVDRIIGGTRPFSELIFKGPTDELVYSPNAHVALVAIGIAKLVHGIELGKIQQRPKFVIGSSAGLIPAMVATGVVGLEDGVNIAKMRGVLTQEATDLAGEVGMETIISVQSAKGQIESLAYQACEEEMNENGGVVAVSGIYSPAAIGITGDTKRIEGVNQRLKPYSKNIRPQTGITIVSHSPYMIPAAEKMSEYLEWFNFSDPWYPLVMNGVKVTNGNMVKTRLPQELVDPVKLTSSVETIMGSGGVANASEFVYGLSEKTPWARFIAETIGDRIQDFTQIRI